MSFKVLSGRLALVLAVVAATNRALAAPAPAPPVKEPGESAQYRALLEEAVSEYDARRFEEARALFRRAHDISPNARTLRGIGMASFELREYVEALRSLEGALADKRRPLTSTQRQQVEGLLERTRAFVGRFFVKLSPKDATLRIDSAPAMLESDGSLLLSFGRHSLTAEAAGSLPENREINVIGGERQELAFELSVDPNAASSRRAAGTVVGAPVAGPGTAGEGQSSAATWLFGGAAVAAAGAIIGFLFWRNVSPELDICNAANQPNGRGCSNHSLLLLEDRLALAGGIAGSAAAVGLAIAGTVIWSNNHSRSDMGTALACAPVRGAVSCELRISF
jgi:tetratricopeptide (TPR) repeat protein